jgi:predicted GH43/DUF377 family glycosyl hydrolase
LTQAIFFNRQALHLHPDPARVVVRPFKPATEPRDRNPTDKTRAKHIVDRVMALDAATVASLYSDDLHRWNGGEAILKPLFPWEFVQIGNCGSPIELDEGWLLLTHGVGPVRQYSIGAVLLDKQNPARIIARSREPQQCCAVS